MLTINSTDISVNEEEYDSEDFSPRAMGGKNEMLFFKIIEY